MGPLASQTDDTKPTPRSTWRRPTVLLGVLLAMLLLRHAEMVHTALSQAGLATTTPARALAKDDPAKRAARPFSAGSRPLIRWVKSEGLDDGVTRAAIGQATRLFGASVDYALATTPGFPAARARDVLAWASQPVEWWQLSPVRPGKEGGVGGGARPLRRGLGTSWPAAWPRGQAWHCGRARCRERCWSARCAFVPATPPWRPPPGPAARTRAHPRSPRPRRPDPQRPDATPSLPPAPRRAVGQPLPRPHAVARALPHLDLGLLVEVVPG
jgi:hypothetical protein